MRIDIWSDVVCPFCYIGKRHLEAALAGRPGAERSQIVRHSFELDPQAPAEAGTHADVLAEKYGMTGAQVSAADASLTAQAALSGLDFHLADSRPGNSFDAHRLLHLAADLGLQHALEERLFSAYFTEGVAISDHGQLRRCATEVGLDDGRVAAVLGSDEYAEDVRADESVADDLGVSGVPFFVFDRRVAVSGAQPVEVFQEALARAAG